VRLQRSVHVRILSKFMFVLLRQFANEMGQNVDYHVFIDSPTGEERQADTLFYSLNNECTHDRLGRRTTCRQGSPAPRGTAAAPTELRTPLGSFGSKFTFRATRSARQIYPR
jgi:hypothetical protein